MTHKFKVGDKVLVKAEVDKHKLGNILTCIDLDTEGYPIFSGDREQDIGWSNWAEYFSLIETDNVSHPPHYTSHPSGIECIQVTEHFGFCIGNAIKYLWRADLKQDAMEDLQKAAWYINREIKRRGGAVEGEE